MQQQQQQQQQFFGGIQKEEEERVEGVACLSDFKNPARAESGALPSTRGGWGSWQSWRSRAAAASTRASRPCLRHTREGGVRARGPRRLTVDSPKKRRDLGSLTHERTRPRDAAREDCARKAVSPAHAATTAKSSRNSTGCSVSFFFFETNNAVRSTVVTAAGGARSS